MKPDFTKEKGYLDEIKLRQILMYILPDDQSFVLYKRKQLIKFINSHKAKIVPDILTENQLEQLNRKPLKNRIPEYYSKSDLLRIFDFLNNNKDSKVRDIQKAIVYFMIKSGARPQEVCDYDESWVWEEQKHIKVIGKGKKERSINVILDLIDFILDFKKKYNSTNNKTFRNKYKKEYKPMFLNSHSKPFTVRGIEKFFEHINANVQLPHKLSPRILRHTYGVHAVLDGVNVMTIMENMGHTDLKTTQIYVKLADKERKREIEEKTRPDALDRMMRNESEKGVVTNLVTEIKGKFCIICGHELPREANFCSHCGGKQNAI
ncbi:MAG: tyrosine-type recombinase/integrase [archaeon]